MKRRDEKSTARLASQDRLHTEPVHRYRGELGASVYADYVHYRDRARVFSDVLGYDAVVTTLQVRNGGSPSVADGRFVTGNYFRGLGVSAATGRVLAPDDDHEQGPHAVVISASMR